LSDTVQGGESVLDYGCGSGILGIAAVRLGAGTVLGVDIDDNALIAARDNAAGNHVTLRLRHSKDTLQEQFDIVVANILTNPLCVLAPLACGVRRSGWAHCAIRGAGGASGPGYRHLLTAHRTGDRR
jgi:ribosomal protein L11 methylase PrmA